MSTNNYFESVGAWPRHSGHMERTYVLGFLFSLALTLGAFVLVVYHVASAAVIVPLVLIAACIQFMVQVLNFLHLSGEPSSRERLIALGCFTIIMLILVLGSMWIMVNLDARMVPEAAEMEMYMSHETGI